MKQPARNVKLVVAIRPVVRVVRFAMVAAIILLGVMLVIAPRAVVAQPTQPTQPTQPSTAPVATSESNHVSALAVGTASDYWVAVSRPRVGGPVGGAAQPSTDTSPFESTIYLREMGEHQFGVIARFPKKTIALGRWSGRAVVLLEGGQWVSVWQGGSGNGVPLPGGTPMITLAADDRDVWSLATIAGGLDTARTQVATATRPATRAATTTAKSPATTARASADLAAGIVLFRLNGQTWAPVAQLPVDIDKTGRIEQASILSRGDGKVAVALETASGGAMVFDVDATAGAVGSPLALPAGASPVLFAGPRGEPLLWLRRAGASEDAGAVMSLLEGPGRRLGKINLPVVDAPAVAATSALGLIRVLTPGEKPGEVVERRFTPALVEVGKPEPLATLPPPDEAPPWTVYTNIGVFLLMALAVVASYRHRDEVRNSLARRDRPRPARVWIRLSAATIDALPILIGAAVLYARQQPGEYVPTTFTGTIPGLVAVAVYLLHTTVTELIWARTLGKWVFGLRVVNLQGQRPGAGAILARNALRVIDLALLVVFPLPILLLIFSPLRQRPGDAAAGTMVIDIATPTMVDEPEEE
jgi:uncharacterized RDD family membrane protein YckC